MLITGNKTIDFILTLLSLAGMFCFGFYFAFCAPKRIRKAIAEGKTLATDKTGQWIKRAGIFLIALCPLAFAFMIFLFVTGRW